MGKPEVDRSRIVFLDLETSGLEMGEESFDGRWASVLELALLLVDAETLEPIDSMCVPVWNSPETVVCSDYVHQMHEETGLWVRIHSEGVPAVQAYSAAVGWLRTHGYGPGDERGPLAYMAGNGIDRFDRRILAHYCSELDDLFHYRSLDVSAVKHAMSFAGVELDHDGEHPDLVQHSALADCEASRRDWASVRAQLRRYQDAGAAVARGMAYVDGGRA